MIEFYIIQLANIQMTVRDALNSALDEEIARDDKVFFDWRRSSQI